MCLIQKLLCFFLGLFTALISETKNYFLLSFIGILLVVQTIAWFVLVSYFFTQIEIQKKYYHYEQRINQILGLILILLAISLLVFN